MVRSKSNSFKVFGSKKTKGSKQDSQNLPHNTFKLFGIIILQYVSSIENQV
jgi:hypothetical protein